MNYSSNVDKKNRIYRQLDPDSLSENVDLNSIINPIKVILINILDSIFSDILNIVNLKGNLNVIKHSGEKNIDITSAGINKYSTLRKYCTEPYYCFGNDSQ
ncbi:hypothetical protein [Lactobacillus terrae]|uniref:hypothetical protein n=1 Tax=Lactobacillus terrae TaxID=2269374 RepID=UPI000C1B7199|nr:hypothetical protein [Lactobacillus terrae]